jgi:hypothetical protein
MNDNSKALSVEEGNKLIHEFMNTSELLCYPEHYHSDWNKLMPVIGKIDNHAQFMIQNGGCYIDKESGAGYIDIASCEYPTLIESVWQACIQFIIWYNNSQNQKQ